MSDYQPQPLSSQIPSVELPNAEQVLARQFPTQNVLCNQYLLFLANGVSNDSQGDAMIDEVLGDDVNDTVKQLKRMVIAQQRELAHYKVQKYYRPGMSIEEGLELAVREYDLPWIIIWAIRKVRYYTMVKKFKTVDPIKHYGTHFFNTYKSVDYHEYLDDADVLNKAIHYNSLHPCSPQVKKQVIPPVQQQQQVQPPNVVPHSFQPIIQQIPSQIVTATTQFTSPTMDFQLEPTISTKKRKIQAYPSGLAPSWDAKQ